jgi:hypothetical protein
MPPGAVDLYMTMLFAYQGMGNLISLTKPGDPGTIYYDALIDFGTTSYSECDETVNFVGNYLTRGGTKNAVLDMVVISHKDHDHWSLFDNLIKYLTGIGRNLVIKKLIYGGYYNTFSKTNGKNIIDRLYPLITSPTVKGNFVFYEAEASAYTKKNKLAELANFGGVRFTPVAVNVEASVTKSHFDIIANTASLVVAILYLDDSMILPGDATADTIAYINKLLAGGSAGEIKSPRLLSVPHHGALRTIASNYLAKDPDLVIAETFAEEIQADTAGASAGFATHHHPDEGVLNIFKPYMLPRPKKHDYVSYHRDLSKWKVTSTDDGIFTTYLSVGSDGKKLGAVKRRIVFRILADGSFKIALIPLDQGGLVEMMKSAVTLATFAPRGSTAPAKEPSRKFVATSVSS